MMKSLPLVSKLRLSKVCRWILTLGVIKLALLFGLILLPQMRGDEPGLSLFGGVAVAANPFATAPMPEQPPRQPREEETPAFGLMRPGEDVVAQAPITSMPIGAPPAPRINPNQTSPFAQSMPQHARPDEATQEKAPAPAVTPLIPRDSSSRKQDELRRREQELLALQQQMQSRLEELKKIEGNVQTMLQQADTSQNDKMRHLVDVYANMKARQAAEVLTNLDERIAVQILSGMRGRQAGEILTHMNAAKAAKLSEALSRTQLPR